MYKLGDIPGIYSNISELADFLEIKCLLNDECMYSLYSAKSALSMESDECSSEGIESGDDYIYRKLEEVLVEIKERSQRSHNRYPFRAEENLVRLNHYRGQYFYIYIYLLLVTRISMKGSNRMANGIDGTLLFEELSEIVIKNYFGENTKSLIFGTSANGDLTFQQKVQYLLSELGEGGSFKKPSGSTGRQHDGKLDIIAWKSFSDNRGGQLIGMGQCKTGTSWRNSLGQLQPSVFFGSYTTLTPYLEPVRLFFVAESCRESWEENARSAGILFDRCRCMNFLPNNGIPKTLYDRIKKWVDLKLDQER